MIMTLLDVFGIQLLSGRKIHRPQATFVLPSQLAYVAISGGLLALTLVGLRAVTPRIAAAAARRPDVRLPRVLTAGEPMPYGVAIACGTVLAIQKTPLLAVLVT